MESLGYLLLGFGIVLAAGVLWLALIILRHLKPLGWAIVAGIVVIGYLIT